MLLRRYRDGIIARPRKWHRPTATMGRFHPLITYRLNHDPGHGVVGVHHFTLTLSRVQPDVKIEVNAPWPIEREEMEEVEKGFLQDAREAILIMVRIMVVGSVISTLLATYLITRLTHATLFPTILRRGECSYFIFVALPINLFFCSQLTDIL